VHIVQKQHACNVSTHALTRAGVCMHPNRHACTLTLVGLPIVLTFYTNMMSCVFASMHKEQRKARAWGLFVDHPGYCHARRSLLVYCAMCASSRSPLLNARCSCAAALLGPAGNPRSLTIYSRPAAGFMSCPGVLQCDRLLRHWACCYLCCVCPP